MPSIIPTPYNWSLWLLMGMQTSRKVLLMSRLSRTLGAQNKRIRAPSLLKRRGLILVYTAGWEMKQKLNTVPRHRVFCNKEAFMKRSKSDIVFIIFEILIFAVITAWLVFAIAAIVSAGNTEGPNDQYEFAGMLFAGIVFLLLTFYFNIGSFLFSFAFLVAALYFKKEFVKKADKEAEGYEKCLKIKKRNVMHFGLLMAYSVVSVILIYIVG